MSITYGGPTAERLQKSGGEYVIGGDERSKSRIYRFQDSPLQRLYSDWLRVDKSTDGQEQLGKELLALCRYRDHWHWAGLEPHVGSIDLNRVSGSGEPHGMAKTERQAYHRAVYRLAVQRLGVMQSRIIEHIACEERAIVDFPDVTPPTFRVRLRKAACQLAEDWK